MRISKFLILTAVLLFTSSAAFAWSDWLTLKTEHFTVFYKPGHDTEARQVLETMEYYRPQVETLCGNQAFHFPVVIDDTGISVNGFSDPVNSYAHLFRHTPGVWAGTENWWSLVGVHEYTHQLSLSKTGGAPKVIGNIFGNNIMLMPNIMTPGWLMEGITVYSESQHSLYQGRLNDGLFDAYIGARVAEDKFPTILEGTYTPLEYPSGSGIYNYGGEFFQYLATTYGEDKFARFFEINGSSVWGLIPFTFFPTLSIDRSAREVYGKSFPELWKDWEEYEKERFKDFQMEGRQFTNTGWSVDSPEIFANHLYYQQYYPKKTNAFNGFSFSEIIQKDLSTDQERVIVSTTSDFVTSLKIKGNKLYYATNEHKPGYANAALESYGYYAVLHQKDLATKKDRVILKTELRSFEVLADGKIIYTKDRETAFGSEFYLLDPTSKRSTKLFETDYLVEEIAMSNEKTVVTARKDWEAFSLFLLNMDNQEFTPIINTPYHEFGISLQGEKLFFTANYGKKVSSYCYDFSSAKVYRLTENGLAAYPAYDQFHNQLYYVGLNSNGHDIYCKDADFTQYDLPENPATIHPVFNLTDSEITQGTYLDNLKTLAPKFWLPLIDSDTERYGIHFEGGDAVMDFPYYVGSFGYDYQEDKYFGSLDLELNFFAPFQVDVSYEDDDERTARLGLAYPLISRLEPGISDLTIGTSLNYDPDYDGLEVEPFFTTGFQYPTTKGSLAVSRPESKLKNGDQRSGAYAELILNQYLPQSELTAKAKYIDDPDNPDDVFAEIRGYDDELTAKKGTIYTLEFSKPIWQIRKGFWNPNVYFEDVVLTLFGDAAVPETGTKQSSWGIELHFETKLMYCAPLDWGYRFVRIDTDENSHDIFFNTVF